MTTIQKQLISRLVAENGLSFKALANGYDSDDNVVYHIKHLISLDLISKRNSKYYLTQKGLIKSVDLDLDNLEEKKYKIFYVSFICNYEDKYLLRSKKYLDKMVLRLIGNKPFFGETEQEYLDRIFNTETGLNLPTSRFKFNSCHLKMQKTEKDSVLFDNIMYVYKVTLSSKEFELVKIRENNLWMNKREIRKIKNIWPELKISILNKSTSKFYNYEFKSNYNIDEQDL